MVRILHCQKGSIPFMNLVVLIGANMNRVSLVVDKFKSKPTAWKAKSL